MGVRYVYSNGDDGAVLKPTGQGLIEDRIYEILYADDCVLLDQSEEAMQIMLTVFDGISAQFGQQISVKKTKLMVVDRHRHPVIIVEDEEGKEVEQIENPPRMFVRNIQLEVVTCFEYLGSLEHCEGTMDKEIRKRVIGMNTAFAILESGVYRNSKIRLTARGRVFEACVTSVGTYGAAVWNIQTGHLDELDNAYFGYVRKMMGHRRTQHIRRETHLSILLACGIRLLPLRVQVYRAQMRYLAHVYRMKPAQLQRKILFSSLVGAVWDKRAPRISHRHSIYHALDAMGVRRDDWYLMAPIRETWQSYVDDKGVRFAMAAWLHKRQVRRMARQEGQTPSGDEEMEKGVPVEVDQMSGMCATSPIVEDADSDNGGGMDDQDGAGEAVEEWARWANMDSDEEDDAEATADSGTGAGDSTSGDTDHGVEIGRDESHLDAATCV